MENRLTEQPLIDYNFIYNSHVHFYTQYMHGKSVCK